MPGGVPLGMPPTKTKIVSCKDGKRNSTSSDTAFGPGWFDAPETTHCSGPSTWRSARVGMAPLLFPDKAGFESLALVKPYKAANPPALATATGLEVSGNGPFNNGEMK
jgi:hypothetical protein